MFYKNDETKFHRKSDEEEKFRDENRKKRRNIFPLGKTNYYNVAMQFFKKLVRTFMRIDNFNRLIVFVSMCLFVLMPSYTLYFVNEDNSNLNTVMPCLLVIAPLIATGMLTLYKPLRTTWFYFLEMIAVIALGYQNFHYTNIDMPSNLSVLIILEVVYSIVGMMINIIYYLRFLYNRRRGKSEFNEATHNDNPYEFLNGQESNKGIQKELENINKEGGEGEFFSALTKGKLSRNTRNVTAAIAFICFLIYVIQTMVNGSYMNSQISVICVCGLLTTGLTTVASALYPSDFKYIHYSSILIFLILAIVCCSEGEAYNPLFLIISAILVGLSLLVTLIVEGRTWTGAKPN